MKTLVTGGSGFVGSAVIWELLKRGQNVRALVRSRAHPGNLADIDVEIVEGDLLDGDSLKRAAQGCDKVYHVAAVYANWLVDMSVMGRSNIQGTRNMLQACFDCGARRLHQFGRGARRARQIACE